MIAAAALAVATAIAVRVVSLAPALTEDLFAIGAGAQVVGVDDLSNRPPAALRVPRVGSMRTINSEAIAALNPDLVVGIAYQAPTLRDLSRVGVHTQALTVDSLADDFAAIAALGRATGHVREATGLLATIRHRLDAVRAYNARAERTARVGVHRDGHRAVLHRGTRVVHRRPVCRREHPQRRRQSARGVPGTFQ